MTSPHCYCVTIPPPPSRRRPELAAQQVVLVADAIVHMQVVRGEPTGTQGGGGGMHACMQLLAGRTPAHESTRLPGPLHHGGITCSVACLRCLPVTALLLPRLLVKGFSAPPLPPPPLARAGHPPHFAPGGPRRSHHGPRSHHLQEGDAARQAGRSGTRFRHGPGFGP